MKLCGESQCLSVPVSSSSASESVFLDDMDNCSTDSSLGECVNRQNLMGESSVPSWLKLVSINPYMLPMAKLANTK